MIVTFFNYSNGELICEQEMAEVENGEQVKFNIKLNHIMINNGSFVVKWSSEPYNNKQTALVKYLPTTGVITADKELKVDLVTAQSPLINLLSLINIQYGEESAEYKTVNKTIEILNHFIKMK